jgi:hypothetical protein
MGFGRPNNLPEVRSLFLFLTDGFLVGKDDVFVCFTGLGKFSKAENILSLTTEDRTKCITASRRNNT